MADYSVGKVQLEPARDKIETDLAKRRPIRKGGVLAQSEPTMTSPGFTAPGDIRRGRGGRRSREFVPYGGDAAGQRIQLPPDMTDQDLDELAEFLRMSEMSPEVLSELNKYSDSSPVPGDLPVLSQPPEPQPLAPHESFVLPSKPGWFR